MTLAELTRRKHPEQMDDIRDKLVRALDKALDNAHLMEMKELKTAADMYGVLVSSSKEDNQEGLLANLLTQYAGRTMLSTADRQITLQQAGTY